MKSRYFLLPLLLIFVFSCQKKERQNFTTKNILNEIFKVEPQIFKIDTTEYSTFITNGGTKIHIFKDIFDVESIQDISLEVEEYYTLRDLVSRNVQTLTKGDSLLESEAVIQLNFKVNEKKINLKKEKGVYVELPVRIGEKDRLYNGSFNSYNQMEWQMAKDQKIGFTYLDTSYLDKYGVDKLIWKQIPIDSLEYYKDNYITEEEYREEQIIDSIKYADANLFIKNFNWINIDRVVKPIGYIEINLNLKNNEQYDYVNSFVLYKGLRSFISYSNKFDRFFENEIPLTENTYIFTIAKTDDNYFSNLIEIDIETDKELQIKLEKTDQLEIKSFFDSF